MKQQEMIPLGKVLHLVEREAITRPGKAILRKGATVYTTKNKKIGKLGDPFGPISNPYLPIILFLPVPENIVGELVIARWQPRKSGKSNRRKQKPNR